MAYLAVSHFQVWWLPQIIGEPVRWPLLVRGNMAQGPDATRDFVQGLIQARLKEAWMLPRGARQQPVGLSVV